MFDIMEVKKFLVSRFGKKDIILSFILISFFFLTRLINLDQFPIFSDEGIYIHWAKVAWHDASWRFISLTDGRQPLQTWATIPFLKLFPDNMLLAGRLFGVTTGFVALIGIFVLLYYLFNKKTAFIGVFLYIITPYFLFYDRLALIDSGVNASFVWILFFSLLLIKTLRLDVALIFGLTAGMALLAKSSTSLFLGFSALSPIAIFSLQKKFFKQLINYLILFLFVLFLAFSIYNIQRLSPFLHFVAQKNNTFIMSLTEFRQNPFAFFWQNLPNIPLYIFWEMGFLPALAGLIGWVLLYKKDKRLFFYISLWIICSYVGIAFFNKVLFPRYLIFLACMLLITASYALNKLKIKYLKILLPVSFFLLLYFNYPIIFDYKNIPFPPVDRGQYLEAWPAGWGIKEIIDYARFKSQTKPVLLLAEGNFGMAGDVLDSTLKRDDKIGISGYWPLDENSLKLHQKDLKEKYVYVVFSHRDTFPKTWPIKFIKKYDKPGNKSAIYLYELIK